MNHPRSTLELPGLISTDIVTSTANVTIERNEQVTQPTLLANSALTPSFIDGILKVHQQEPQDDALRMDMGDIKGNSIVFGINKVSAQRWLVCDGNVLSPIERPSATLLLPIEYGALSGPRVSHVVQTETGRISFDGLSATQVRAISHSGLITARDVELQEGGFTSRKSNIGLNNVRAVGAVSLGTKTGHIDVYNSRAEQWQVTFGSKRKGSMNFEETTGRRSVTIL